MNIINSIAHFHPHRIISNTGSLNCRGIYFANGRNGIAEISFNPPDCKVSVLSLATLEAFGNLLDQAKNSHPKALVINIENLAGADLRMIRQGLDDPIFLEKVIKTGHRVFYQLATLPFPTIAFIHKACLGGALEAGLACTYRVVTDDPKTIVGLPEVTLGLFPCWGGTQRLPPLVGRPQALNLIMNGETISGQKAKEIQLADAIFSRELLDEKGREFIDLCLTPEGKKEIMENRQKKTYPSWPGFSQERYEATGLIACDLIYKTTVISLDRGLEEEGRAFLQMPVKTVEQAKKLISAFLDKKGLDFKKE